MPNYAARRMLVGTVVVTALFAAGIVGWRIARDGDGDGSELPGSGWSSLAFVDRVTGDVVYVGGDGEVVGESAGNGRTGSVHGFGDALTLVNSQRIAVLPEPGSTDGPLVVQLPRGAVMVPVMGLEVDYLAAGNPTGGNVVVVDPGRGTRHDLGELVAGTLGATPAMLVDSLRTNADGSIVAVADATNFQTIVLQPARDEPVFLPDQPIAVGDTLVATSQIVGTQADVALVGLDRSTKAAVPIEMPVGGVFDGDTLVVVSTAGRVFRISAGDDSPQRAGAIDVPSGAAVTSVRPAYGGRRLVIGGPTFEAVVDLQGEVIFSTTFAAEIDAVAPQPDWACLPVGGGSHSIIDLGSGEQLADLTGADIAGVGDQGCAVLARRNGVTEVIAADGIATIGVVASALLAPDGRAVVRTTTDGAVELLLLADDLGLADTIDLTAIAAGVSGDPLVTFVESRG